MICFQYGNGRYIERCGSSGSVGRSSESGIFFCHVMDVRSRDRGWMMIWDVANRIRRSPIENPVESVGRRGECSGGNRGVLVQCDIKMAKVGKRVDRCTVRGPFLRFQDDFVPEVTKFVL